MFRSTASVAGQAPLTASVAGQAPLTASVAGQAPLIFALALAGCLSEEPQGIAKAQTALTTVVMDFEHRPLPEIPLPNDIATRHDSTSATGRRINASLVAPTGLEGEVRELIDQLDGWGLLMPISIPFSGPLDIQSILDGHRDADYDPSNDVVYLIDITEGSPDYGELQLLDVGNGNYPAGTEKRDDYWANDPRGDTLSILFEEHDEDLNDNGKLDPGEDTDGDGVLDKPNYLPGAEPAWDDLRARADALMTFYERETNTLILQPMVPLRERTTYAMVVTRRLKDADGNPVGSPFPYVNHHGQTEALKNLEDVLPSGLALKDIAFTFSFTTQSAQSEWIAVRDGLYGHGLQAHLSKEFPAEVAEVLPALDSGDNVHVMRAEKFDGALRLLNTVFRGATADSRAFQQLIEANRYVDYYVVGSYDSPQLFDRRDEDGNLLHPHKQVWPFDLDRNKASARAERVYFTLVVPRKEISARKDGKPAPTVILGHGHTGNRFDAINLGPFFARHGLATLAIDNPGHGLSLSDEDKDQARTVLSAFGIGPFIEAAFTDRSFDQNGDGVTDSGADYWDFYLFHTRDNVRQTALDYMQLIRILRGFDGERSFGFDLDGDGENELAGDFDGDGEIDVGGDAAFTMSGGSLGGIMSMLMAGIEPEIKAIAPVVGGGGLGFVARRSFNSSVRRAVIMRTFGPLYVGNIEDGSMTVRTVVPDINERPPEFPLGKVDGVEPGDTMVVRNLRSEEQECGHVDPDGRVRAPLASDLGDPIEIEFYKGDVQVAKDCVLKSGAKPYAALDTFEETQVFHAQVREAGEPLAAMAEGLGLRRGTPDLRRFVGLGQLVMDRCDPAIYARHLTMEPLEYPGTGQKTGAHAMITTGIGDLNVPVDAGQTFARAAGILEWREPNPAFGVPDNQVLIDNYVMEAMDELKRFTDVNDKGVLMDPDNWSNDNDQWRARELPRLDPPLRSGFDKKDALGGYSANTFGYGSPEGRHGFDDPGTMTDNTRKECREACAEGEDCGCDTLDVFDVGNFHFNLMGDYLASEGKRLDPDPCHAAWNCAAIPDPPAGR